MASRGSSRIQRKMALRALFLITLVVLASSQPPAPSPTHVDVLGLGPQFSNVTTYMYQYGVVQYFLQLATVYGATLLAPSDEGFAQLSQQSPELLTCISQNATAFQKLLLYHAIVGNYPAAQVLTMNMTQLPTAQGEYVEIVINGTGTVWMDGDVIVEYPDLMVIPNATVHGVGAVLIPVAALEYIASCPQPSLAATFP
eukprot:TRINITY_DN5047_c0_g1_i5.p1 TRINITY_DN5047_c0_g1~~TRINITY_DN5047_c0_g1_i5.p1  ORF type:complete len:199 (+),score=16.61 TRINITY_DN5047_c0_g1_i5:319-915(+)